MRRRPIASDSVLAAWPSGENWQSKLLQRENLPWKFRLVWRILAFNGIAALFFQLLKSVYNIIQLYLTWEYMGLLFDIDIIWEYVRFSFGEIWKAEERKHCAGAGAQAFKECSCGGFGSLRVDHNT